MTDAPVGFSASINGATLADLVQMECLSGARCVARITSGENVGYLYFNRGRVAHAMSPSNIGEAAALEILGWTTGSFELVDAGWPDAESITTSFQNLLMRVAQARDESGRHNLLRFPRARSEEPTPAGNPRAPMSSRDDRPPPNEPKLGTLPAAGAAAAPASGVTRAQVAVRLDANGVVLARAGSGSEELADVVALASRLARLVGDSLGLDDLLAIEAGSPNMRTLIVVEKTGGLVGVRAPSEADLASVRERYHV